MSQNSVRSCDVTCEKKRTNSTKCNQIGDILCNFCWFHLNECKPNDCFCVVGLNGQPSIEISSSCFEKHNFLFCLLNDVYHFRLNRLCRCDSIMVYIQLFRWPFLVSNLMRHLFDWAVICEAYHFRFSRWEQRHELRQCVRVRAIAFTLTRIHRVSKIVTRWVTASKLSFRVKMIPLLWWRLCYRISVIKNLFPTSIRFRMEKPHSSWLILFSFISS